MKKGSCVCGAIKFQVNQSLEAGEICHCLQCRKWTGHFFASVDIARKNLTIEDESFLNWYQSSSKARRGFCTKCGSSIFFDPLDKQKHNWISIALGSFDSKTDIQIEKHIFVAEKGDYYQILDSAVQNLK